MIVNKVGAKVLIPTIIVYRGFISLNFLNYEIIVYSYDKE